MKIALMAVVYALGMTGALAQPADTQTAQPEPPKRNSICLNAGDIDQLTFPDDKTILFHMRGGKVRIWRNDLPYTCHGMKFQGGIAWEIRGGEICSHMQTFWVLERWTPCMLGDFSPYTPPPKDAEGH